MSVQSSKLGWTNFLPRNPRLLTLTLEAACLWCSQAQATDLVFPSQPAAQRPPQGSVTRLHPGTMVLAPPAAAVTPSTSQFCSSHVGRKGSAVTGRSAYISYTSRTWRKAAWGWRGSCLKAPMSQHLSFCSQWLSWSQHGSVPPGMMPKQKPQPLPLAQERGLHTDLWFTSGPHHVPGLSLLRGR